MFVCHESQLVVFESCYFLPRERVGLFSVDERPILGVWKEPQLEATCLYFCFNPQVFKVPKKNPKVSEQEGL